jgi:hypothetical protein
MKLTRDKLNRHPSANGKWPDLEPESQPQSIHFYVCRACGQAVDMRKLGDLIHHEQPEHEPISPVESE